MTNNLLNNMQNYFKSISEEVFKGLTSGEELLFNLSAEQTDFLRFNQAQVRQTGQVNAASVNAKLMSQNKTVLFSFSLSSDRERDLFAAKNCLHNARLVIDNTSVDHYQIPFTAPEISTQIIGGELPNSESLPAQLLTEAGNTDFVGYYAGGTKIRAMISSVGHYHYFSTVSFFVNYSFFVSNGRAIKGTYAGNVWNQKAYETQIKGDLQKLPVIAKEPVSISPGKYRCYLCPAAVNELTEMLAFMMGEAFIRQANSPLIKVRSGEKAFSPLFTLLEDYTRISVPRFNAEGELAPATLEVIKQGKLASTLISSRTAKEYGLESNFAAMGEGMSAPVIEPGTLSEANILSELGEGLYISNLHYLNPSDIAAGRLTGMTRYACFLVKNGKLVAPINDLRFDETIFSLFGDNLVSLTDKQYFMPNTSTYGETSIGGNLVPGMLVNNFTFTL